MEPREAERSQGLVKFLVRTAFRGEPLFRSSRPDFIETRTNIFQRPAQDPNCSGLPDRTSLRHAFPLTFHTQPIIVPVFQTGLH